MRIWIVTGSFLFALAGLSYGVGPSENRSTAGPSNEKQMETDQERAQRSEQVTPLNQQGGKLTGEVVGVNPSEGTLELKTVEGGITKLKVEDKIKEQLKEIKKGDQIEAKIMIHATSIAPKQEG